MCAIVGSFDTNKLHELVKLNMHRGSYSYSFSLYDCYTGRLIVMKQDFGEPDFSIINVPQRTYGVVHVQAPTTESTSMESIHPATAYPLSTFTKDKHNVLKEFNTCLWHNGILKESAIKKLQQSNGEVKWDTMLMLCELIGSGWSSFSKFDGSFSCLFYNNYSMFLFRNEISPMFIDDELNISSSRFQGSRETEANKVLKMEFDFKSAAPIFTFKTIENPYYFGD